MYEWDTSQRQHTVTRRFAQSQHGKGNVAGETDPGTVVSFFERRHRTLLKQTLRYLRDDIDVFRRTALATTKAASPLSGSHFPHELESKRAQVTHFLDSLLECVPPRYTATNKQQPIAEAEAQSRAMRLFSELVSQQLLCDVHVYAMLLVLHDNAPLLNKMFAIVKRSLPSSLKPATGLTASGSNSSKVLIDTTNNRRYVFPLGRRAFNRILDVLAVHGQEKTARKVFDFMRSVGVSPDSMTYGHLMRGCLQTGRFNSGYEYFLQADRDNEMHGTLRPQEYRVAINLLAEAGDLDRCMRLFLDLNRRFADNSAGRAAVIDASTINIVLKCCAKANAHSLAFYVFESMQSKFAVQPTAVTFTTLINICHRMQDADRAQSLFDQMCEAGIEPDHGCYSTLLQCYATAGDEPRMLETIKAAREYYERTGDPPTIDSYEVLINYYAQRGDVDTCIAYIAEMRANGITPKLDTINLILKSCLRADDFENSVFIFNKLVAEAGGSPTGHSSWQIGRDGPLLSQQSATSHQSTATYIPGSHGSGGRASTTTAASTDRSMVVKPYNTLMHLFAVHRDASSCLAFLSYMRAQGVDPDIRTYTTLIGCCARERDFGKAIELYYEAKAAAQRGELAIDMRFFHSVISAFASAEDSDKYSFAFDVFDDVLAFGLQPTTETINRVLMVLSSAAAVDDGLRFLERIIALRKTLPQDVSRGICLDAVSLIWLLRLFIGTQSPFVFRIVVDAALNRDMIFGPRFIEAVTEYCASGRSSPIDLLQLIYSLDSRALLSLGAKRYLATRALPRMEQLFPDMVVRQPDSTLADPHPDYDPELFAALDTADADDMNPDTTVIITYKYMIRPQTASTDVHISEPEYALLSAPVASQTHDEAGNTTGYSSGDGSSWPPVAGAEQSPFDQQEFSDDSEAAKRKRYLERRRQKLFFEHYRLHGGGHSGDIFTSNDQRQALQLRDIIAELLTEPVNSDTAAATTWKSAIARAPATRRRSSAKQHN